MLSACPRNIIRLTKHVFFFSFFLFSGFASKVTIFSDTINMINANLCMTVVLTELYLSIPRSVTLIVFQGHDNVEHF